MPGIQPFALTLFVGGIIAGCVFARSIRIVLMLALVTGAFYLYRNAADLDSASRLMSSVAARAGSLFSSVHPLAWLACVFARASG